MNVLGRTGRGLADGGGMFWQALWAGGISFGGTIAFVFADLITLPLLLIYRRYYGTWLTLKLAAVCWAMMSIVGLVTEPARRDAGPVLLTSDNQGVAR